jgi:hypothetical protein
MEWESSHFYPFPPVWSARFSPLAFGIGDREHNRPEHTHITAETSGNEVRATICNEVASKMFISSSPTFAEYHGLCCLLII